jgi:hypothetical protein
MTTASALESLPVAWSPADDTFFRVVASVFPPEFTAGAGVLLGSYDDEQLPVMADAAPTTSSAADAERPVRVTA